MAIVKMEWDTEIQKKNVRNFIDVLIIIGLLQIALLFIIFVLYNL